MCFSTCFAISSTENYTYNPEIDIIDLTHPESFSDQVFVITSGKSGTHLLLCSIMNITKRPVRTLFPDLCISTNLLDEDLDVSKKTIYFGHDENILNQCDRSKNKIITTIRNYKEVILSYLILSHKVSVPQNKEEALWLEEIFLDEILNNKIYFRLYMDRLVFFDNWPNKFLVKFEDLIYYPENYLPQILLFLEEENCDLQNFLNNYESFKNRLSVAYAIKKAEVNLGSREDFYYFRKFISKKALVQVDNYVKDHYPLLWEKYLKDQAEL